MCQGCVKGVSRVRVLWIGFIVCQGCVKGVSRVCVKGVSRVCQGYEYCGSVLLCRRVLVNNIKDLTTIK